ncbi:LamG-like jellyroll fold domain-containing protein [Halovulum sp. GXIMD14794]
MTILPSKTSPVLERLADRHYSGMPGDYRDFGHKGALELNRGTVSLNFKADVLYGDMALISKDLSGQGAGQFTVWIKDGTLLVTQESGSGTEYLKVPELVLAADTTYHLAMSFGKKGLEVWLNGQLVASEPEFKQGIGGNDAPLVVGATRAWRSEPTDEAHSLFRGTIGDVQVYNRQLGQDDMAALAAEADPALGMAAAMAHDMADLLPAFEQMHHGSDTLRELAEDYGLSEHGHMMRPLEMKRAGRGDNELEGGAGDDGLDGNLGDDLVDGKDGADVLQGGYGNDTVLGGRGNDVLDGGHGEDRLLGGAGNDLLISRSDAREPEIARVPGRDERDPYGELTKGKLYPKQPINGDDEMTGGGGADVFYFQTLINAKKRYIEKHTNDDGTIRWHGVAGENDKLHDHWVDQIGHDVVTDYNRAEGDRLVIEGHTTKIKSISYADSNGDGVMDRSLIKLYSDQGSGGGAHHMDSLGRITVYGDLVKRSDIETTAAPAYGIVATSADIRDAVRPTDMAEERGPIRKPAVLPGLEDMMLASGAAPVLAIPTAQDIAGQSQNALVFEHDDALALRNGTIALRFTTGAELTWGALFSKDASGNGRGGHLTAFVEEDGDLVVRLQTATDSHWLVASNVIRADSAYDLAFSFGRDGAALWLDGVKVAYDQDVTQHLFRNAEALIVGANGWNSTPGKADMIHSGFNGTVEEFAVYRKALEADALFGDSKAEGVLALDGSATLYRFALDDKGRLELTRGNETQTVPDDTRFLEFEDLTARPEHVQIGNWRDDTLHGTNASDILVGRRGADMLHGGDHDDLLDGGAGDDRLYAGDGRDTLLGGQGDDYLDGGAHRDLLKGGLGDDELKGGGANDRLYGGLGNDMIFGNSWGMAGGPAERDRAYFDGEFADYDITSETYFNSGRGKDAVRLVVEDSFDGGADGTYEGRDLLYDVDALVFTDLTVSVSDLL